MPLSIWKTTALFTIIGVLWIIITDQLLIWLEIPLTSPEIVLYQTAKGIGFVVFIGFLLYSHLKKTTLRIQKHELAHQRLFRGSPQPSLIFDQDSYKVLAVNEAAIKMYGYSEKEFLKLTIKDLRPSEEVPQLVEHLKAIGKYKRHGIWNHKLKNGQIIQVEVDSQAVEFGEYNARMVLITDQTKLKETQEKIVSTQGDLRSSLTILHVLLDRNGNILETNPAFHRYFPLPGDKEQFLTLQEITDENYHESLLACLQNAKTAKAKKAFCTLCHKPVSLNQSIYFSWEINWLDDQETYLLVGFDVTEKYQSRKELEETTKWLRLLLSSITDGFFTLDKTYNITYVNTEFQRLTQRTESELKGQSIYSVFPQAKETGVIDRLEQVMETKESDSYETYSPTLDRWYQGVAYPFEEGVAIFFRDITEKREMSEQLEFSEKQLVALTKGAQNRIWSVDNEMKFLYMNDAYVQFFKTVTGNTPTIGDYAIAQEVPEDRAKQLREFYERGLNGETFEADYKRTIEGFGEMTNRISFNPIKGEDGNIRGVGCISIDITQRKKREELIQLQNELLKEIAIIASHGTRRPVANILGLIDNLKEMTMDPEVLHQTLGYLFKETAELDGVIQKIVHRVENVEDTFEENEPLVSSQHN